MAEMTPEEIAAQENEYAVQRAQKHLRKNGALAEHNDNRSMVEAIKRYTEQASEQAMTPEEIEIYEAEVAIMRANKPPMRTDLPPITGAFGKHLKD